MKQRRGEGWTRWRMKTVRVVGTRRRWAYERLDVRLRNCQQRGWREERTRRVEMQWTGVARREVESCAGMRGARGVARVVFGG
jgi:hypothetical protein